MAIEQGTDLRTFLIDSAQVSEKFVDMVLAKCDDEMVGDVEQLSMLHEAGLLRDMFKPVVYLGIERALSGSPAVDVSGAASSVRSILSADIASADVVAPKIDLEVEPYHAIMDNLKVNTCKCPLWPLQSL